MKKVEYLTVTTEAGAGQRIDNFLLRRLKNIPKAKVYSILRKGEVRVNKGRIKPSYKLQEQDVVRLPPLEQKSNEFATSKLAFKVSIDILYEDDNLIVVNKQPGLAVHGGSGLNFGLIEVMRLQRPNAKVLELVHRLDRDTSGCIMIAKNNQMLRALNLMLQEGNINKTYNCLVSGFASESFTVDVPLRKFILESGERMVKVHPDGRPSVTKFNVMRRYKNTTLMQAQPVTGRTHQIRVHAKHRGLPIVGDDKYGNKGKARRLFLHARQLDFTCPLTDREIIVTADYDKLWQEGILQYGTR